MSVNQSNVGFSPSESEISGSHPSSFLASEMSGQRLCGSSTEVHLKINPASLGCSSKILLAKSIIVNSSEFPKFTGTSTLNSSIILDH